MVECDSTLMKWTCCSCPDPSTQDKNNPNILRTIYCKGCGHKMCLECRRYPAFEYMDPRDMPGGERVNGEVRPGNHLGFKICREIYEKA